MSDIGHGSQMAGMIGDAVSSLDPKGPSAPVRSTGPGIGTSETHLLDST
jgi:hypothetical protein